MLWILVGLCLIVAILDIAVGGSHYKKYRQFSSLVFCSLGWGVACIYLYDCNHGSIFNVINGEELNDKLFCL